MEFTLDKITPMLIWLSLIVLVYVGFLFFTSFMKRKLLRAAKGKSQVARIVILMKLIHYIFVALLVGFSVTAYFGSWSGFGVAAGLMTAAIGFAMQKPIAGIAAWLIILTQKPFRIGDRIVMGNVKGDVIDLSLTHITIREVGVEQLGEEISGKTVTIPNALLFDQPVLNYALEDDLILGSVTVSVTYESDMEKARYTILESAKKSVIISADGRGPYVRSAFAASSVDITVKFYATYDSVQKIKSSITEEIYHSISKVKGIEFAYPHVEVLMNKSSIKK